MRVLVVGAGGTIGRAVTAALAGRHEVIRAGRNGGDVRVDLTDPASIASMYAEVGTVDAVACAAGHTPYRPLPELTDADFKKGLEDKLMGQVNLVLVGLERVTDGGSFTLISGVTAREPVRTGAVASTVAGGLETFVRAAAVELPRGLRINAVSPTMLTESQERYESVFRGFKPVPVADVALAYVKSIEGPYTGQVHIVE